jgi:hypothetical protein
MTGGDIGLWSGLCGLIFGMLFAIEGVLRIFNGETFGWRVIGVGVVAQLFNGIGLLFFFLR